MKVNQFRATDIGQVVTAAKRRLAVDLKVPSARMRRGTESAMV